MARKKFKNERDFARALREQVSSETPEAVPGYRKYRRRVVEEMTGDDDGGGDADEGEED
jgi:hypothetical protein